MDINLSRTLVAIRGATGW